MPQSKSRSLYRRINFERNLCVILSTCSHIECCGSNNTLCRRNRHCTAVPAFCKARDFSPCIGRIVFENTVIDYNGQCFFAGLAFIAGVCNRIFNLICSRSERHFSVFDRNVRFGFDFGCDILAFPVSCNYFRQRNRDILFTCFQNSAVCTGFRIEVVIL